MKRLLLAMILLGAHSASAYEYKLQFTPQPGARGLVVAGYQLIQNTVAGNCSYYTVSSGSGRGSHSTTTYHYNTCTWDLFGNLISLTPVSGAPVAPPQLSQTGLKLFTRSTVRAAPDWTHEVSGSSTRHPRITPGKPLTAGTPSSLTRFTPLPQLYSVMATFL